MAACTRPADLDRRLHSRPGRDIEGTPALPEKISPQQLAANSEQPATPPTASNVSTPTASNNPFPASTLARRARLHGPRAGGLPDHRRRQRHPTAATHPRTQHAFTGTSRHGESPPRAAWCVERGSFSFYSAAPEPWFRRHRRAPAPSLTQPPALWKTTTHVDKNSTLPYSEQASTPYLSENHDRSTAETSTGPQHARHARHRRRPDRSCSRTNPPQLADGGRQQPAAPRASSEPHSPDAQLHHITLSVTTPYLHTKKPTSSSVTVMESRKRPKKK